MNMYMHSCTRSLCSWLPHLSTTDDIPSSHSRILKGNLAPGGSVAKITGKEGLRFEGKARAFDSENDFVKAVETGEIKKGEKTVVILRYLGPKGGPGESPILFLFCFWVLELLGAYVLVPCSSDLASALLCLLFLFPLSPSSIPGVVFMRHNCCN